MNSLPVWFQVLFWAVQVAGLCCLGLDMRDDG